MKTLALYLTSKMLISGNFRNSDMEVALSYFTLKVRPGARIVQVAHRCPDQTKVTVL